MIGRLGCLPPEWIMIGAGPCLGLGHRQTQPIDALDEVRARTLLALPWIRYEERHLLSERGVVIRASNARMDHDRSSRMLAARMDHDRSRTLSRARASTDSTNRCPRRGPG